MALFVPDHLLETFRPGTGHGGHDGDGRAMRYLEWTRNPDPGGTTRIRADLGYREPIEPDEAIGQTIEWELANLPDELPPNRFDYEAEDAALPDLTLGF